MRVLYLNPFSQEVSGPDESLRSLLAGLVPAGVEAHVVLPAPGPQVERYQALGATVHFAPLAVLRRDLSLTTAALSGPAARARRRAVRAIARAVGADLIHTNMEVLLEGGLAARALGLPHVLHYRGNTLDRPKPVFDALTAAWTATADQRLLHLARDGGGVRAARADGEGRGALQPGRRRALRERAPARARCARRWAPAPATAWSARSAAFTRARIWRRSCAPPRSSRRARPTSAS